MGEKTGISWADHTFNPWIGCTKVSPACDGCYAEAWAARYRSEITWGKPGQRATHHRTKTWAEPVKWNRAAAAKFEATGDATFVFCASLADVFDKHVPAQWRAELFNLIRETPNLTWLLLTKRPGNIVKLWDEARGLNGLDLWPANAAIGCTVIDEVEVGRDVPRLLAAKAELTPAFAFVSMEPLLEAVRLDCIASDAARPAWRYEPGTYDALGGSWWPAVGDYAFEATTAERDLPRVDWVIAGGETDQGSHRARPSHPDWFRSLRDQCAAANVPFHFKQWGEWVQHTPAAGGDLGADVRRGHVTIVHPTGQSDIEVSEATGGRSTIPGSRYMARVGTKAAGRMLDGVLHDARPRVRP